MSEFLLESAGIRFYSRRRADINVIVRAVKRLLPYVHKIFVVVRIGADATKALTVLQQTFSHDRVFVSSPSPWEEKQYAHILNGLMFVAGREHSVKQMLFISPECVISEVALRILAENYNESTLVVGLRLPGHTFKPGWHPVQGSTVPWNQCALVNIQKMAEGPGFSMAGDSIWDFTNAGVEEVVSFRFAQMAYTARDASITLLDVPYAVSFDIRHLKHDPKRAAWDNPSNPSGKIGSKDQRAKQQTDRLPGLEDAVVLHRTVS